jgi:phage tail protein X
MDRYDNNAILLTKDNIRYRASTLYPDIPLSESDVYIYTMRGDRLDNLAYQFYQDSTLWWILTSANPGIPKDSLYPPIGFQLRIPVNPSQIVSDFVALNT